jgi:hypothetical protein
MEVINLILGSMAIFAAIAAAYFKYTEWKWKEKQRK